MSDATIYKHLSAVILIVYCTELHHERMFFPKRKGFLVYPTLAFFTKLAVKIVQHFRQYQTHFVIRHTKSWVSPDIY